MWSSAPLFFCQIVLLCVNITNPSWLRTFFLHATALIQCYFLLGLLCWAVHWSGVLPSTWGCRLYECFNDIFSILSSLYAKIKQTNLSQQFFDFIKDCERAFNFTSLGKKPSILPQRSFHMDNMVAAVSMIHTLIMCAVILPLTRLSVQTFRSSAVPACALPPYYRAERQEMFWKPTGSLHFNELLLTRE